MDKLLLPVKGAWVRLGTDKDAPAGYVIELRNFQSEAQAKVKWHRSNKSDWVPVEKLRNGFKLGMDVIDVPYSRVRQSLGEGVVVDLRNLGGRDQVLVDFLEKGDRRWLPYENLKQVKGVRHRYLTASLGKFRSAEKFRLRSLAYALELWNENTGSLSHLDIDPLPHQIHLVHHILASGNLNWLVADDVGLGKTIEVGMLLSALKQRKKLQRVLLVTPAGLTKQWQDELRYKFGFEEFLIYGEDFHINEPHQWKLFDYVIGSIDRFKDEDNLVKLMQAEPWDLIVFDEAHRLSRRQYGLKFDSSQRFKLAATLRKYSDSLLLLSATPHQGKTDKFQALLELVRPEWKKEIRRVEMNPEILRYMVIRNNKSDVTDAEGNFIFQGKVTSAITVDVGKEACDFDTSLQKYLRLGYAAGKELGFTGNAIGFVMTIYRKLSASSSAAIHGALQRRLKRLLGQNEKESDFEAQDSLDFDQRFSGEREEIFDSDKTQFFDGEIELLQELISKAQFLVKNDLKLDALIQKIILPILENNPAEKILIFSEYRTTQDHLAAALGKRFGGENIELINGSMSHFERSEAIACFEDKAQFLISTEAGGEGINLQRNCHVMVNYDLPWNPMRLVQRIGRLYRYGQNKKVIVLNIHAPQTLDEQIMKLLYERISQVVKDLTSLGDEFRPGLEDDILGEIADLVDVEQILEGATLAGVSKTKEQIDDALQRASEATKKQHELFEFAASFDPNEVKGEFRVKPEHMVAFAEGMFHLLGIEILSQHFNGAVLEIRLPENITDSLPLLSSRLTITFDRVLASKRPKLHLMDLNSQLMSFLLEQAKSYAFGGKTAGIKGIKGRSILTGVLRWQNDQGQRVRQEYTALQVHEDGNVEINPDSFCEWLKHSAIDYEVLISREQCKENFVRFETAADHRLKSVSSRDLHPENRQWVSGAWCEN